MVVLLLGNFLFAFPQATVKGKNIYYVPNYSEYQARNYFESNKLSLHPLEGIWLNDGWKYSIEKDYDGYFRNPNKYRVIILETPSQVIWDPGDIQYFLTPGASGVVEIVFYAWKANWVNGKRDYKIVPENAVGAQNNFNTLTMRLPNFDDYGQTIKYDSESFIKFYPSISTTNNLESEEIRDWSGSGFALKDGYIVTNFHVIDGAKKISIKGINGDFNKSYSAQVVGQDKTNDLAILKIDDSTHISFGNVPYAITAGIAEVGEEIYVLGFPLTATMGDEIKLTTGIISSRTGYQGDVALYQISAPIQPGSSGGPLFDKKGNIIGIVSAKHSGAENVGYAIKASYLKNLIESCLSSSIIPSKNIVFTLPLTEKVKTEKNFVFIIHCSSSN